MKTPLTLALTILFFGVTLPAIAVAELPDQPQSLSGTYVLDEEASDDMIEAFEPAVAKLGAIKRIFARRYLRREVRPDEEIRIEHGATHVSIDAGGRPTIRGPVSGAAFVHTKQDGHKVNMKTRVAGRVLRLDAKEEAGGYTTTYTLSPDGKRLTMVVNLSYEQLPIPVSYRLVYNRK